MPGCGLMEKRQGAAAVQDALRGTGTTEGASRLGLLPPSGDLSAGRRAGDCAPCRTKDMTMPGGQNLLFVVNPPRFCNTSGESNLPHPLPPAPGQITNRNS